MYNYAATIVSVHDADSFTAVIDLGFYASVRVPLRLDGIDAPELKTPEGKAARDYLNNLLAVVGFKVTVDTKKTEKYGRWLATVTLPDGRDLAALLLAEGLAREYHGGKR